MTFGGIGASGEFKTVNTGGGVARFDYEPARGDVSGLVDNLVVIRLQGRQVSSLAPISGYVLSWDGQSWSPTSVAATVSGVGLHNLLSSAHPDTNGFSPPINGDLIAASGSPPSKWSRLPIGLPGQSLKVSNSGIPAWKYDSLQIVTSGVSIILEDTVERVIINKSSPSSTEINLPLSPYFGQEVLVKDGKGDANTNKITVVPPSGQTIDGFPQIILSQNYQSFHFLWNGTNWNVI